MVALELLVVGAQGTEILPSIASSFPPRLPTELWKHRGRRDGYSAAYGRTTREGGNRGRGGGDKPRIEREHIHVLVMPMSLTLWGNKVMIRVDR